MPNWVTVPNSTPVNFDQVTNFYQDRTQVIIQMTDGSTKTVTYPTIAAAGAAFTMLSNAVATTIPGAATLISISPNTMAAGTGAIVLTISGTNFLPSAVITVGGASFAITSINGTTIQGIFNEPTLTPASYDVVYNDAAGGSDTLAAAFTVT